MQYIVNKYKKEGNVVTSPRSGRPKLLDDRTMRLIKRKVSERPSISSTEISDDLNSNLGIKIAPRSIRHNLQNNGLKAYRKATKALLTAPMKKKRLAWCKKYSSVPDKYWEKVVWTDESYISLFSGFEKFVRRPKNTRFQSLFVNQGPKHSLKVMIWGCFSASGVGRIMVVDGSMNTDKYIMILEKKTLTIW